MWHLLTIKVTRPANRYGPASAPESAGSTVRFVARRTTQLLRPAGRIGVDGMAKALGVGTHLSEATARTTFA